MRVRKPVGEKNKTKKLKTFFIWDSELCFVFFCLHTLSHHTHKKKMPRARASAAARQASKLAHARAHSQKRSPSFLSLLSLPLKKASGGYKKNTRGKKNKKEELISCTKRGGDVFFFFLLVVNDDCVREKGKRRGKGREREEVKGHRLSLPLSPPLVFFRLGFFLSFFS